MILIVEPVEIDGGYFAAFVCIDAEFDGPGAFVKANRVKIGAFLRRVLEYQVDGFFRVAFGNALRLWQADLPNLILVQIKVDLAIFEDDVVLPRLLPAYRIHRNRRPKPVE